MPWSNSARGPQLLISLSSRDQDHNYSACVLQLLTPACPGARAPQQKTPLERNKRVAPIAASREKPHSNEDPAQPKNTYILKLKKNFIPM